MGFNRNVRWVSNSANVPRLGLRPNLLLDLAKPQVHAASDTQRTLLVAVSGAFFAMLNIWNLPQEFSPHLRPHELMTPA